MTTLYFNVKGGLKTGNIVLDAATGNVTGVENATLGNLVTANYFTGNGSSLTGLNASNLASGTIGSSILGNSTVYIGTTGVALNRTSATQSLTGVNIDGTANYATYAGTVTTAAQPNITSVGTLASLAVTANITAGNISSQGAIDSTGNVTAPFFIGNVIGNISGTITVPGNNTSVLFNQNGNAGASDNLQFNYATNVLTVTGNLVTTNATLGNLATANYVAGTLTTGAQPNITSVGTLVDANVTGNVLIGGNLVVNGNTVYTNVETMVVEDPIIELGGGPNGDPLTTNDGKDRGTLLHYYTTETVNAFMGWDNSASEFAFGSNVSLSGEVATFNSYGNVHAGYFIGNGSQLTGVAAATATSATTAGTVTTNAQPNITSTGTLNGLTATGVLDFTGASNVSLGPVANVHISGGTSGYLLSTNGSGTLSWTAPPSATSIVNGTSNVSISSSGGNVTTSVGGTANVVVVDTGGANVTGNLTVSGNLIAGNLTTSGSSGNVSGANYVIANYFQGDGSLLTNLNASNISSGTISGTILGNSTVYIGTTGVALNRASGALSLTGITSIDGYAATVSGAAQGNITSVGTLASVAVTGNATVGNIKINGGILSNRANIDVATNTVIDEFAPSTYRTAKYVVSASSADGYQSAEIILVHNGSTAYISIYGSVCSNSTADIVEFSSNINGVSGNVSVYATNAGAGAVVNVVATYLKT